MYIFEFSEAMFSKVMFNKNCFYSEVVFHILLNLKALTTSCIILGGYTVVYALWYFFFFLQPSVLVLAYKCIAIL